MVNFSKFSEKGQQVFAEIIAEKNGTSVEEARESLIAEEAKGSNRGKLLEEAKRAEEQKALFLLKQRNPKVFADIVANDPSKSLETTVTETVKDLQTNFANLLEAVPGVNEIIEEFQSNASQTTGFSTPTTGILVTGIIAKEIDKLIEEIFGKTSGLEFDPEFEVVISGLQSQIETNKQKLQELIKDREQLKKDNANPNIDKNLKQKNKKDINKVSTTITTLHTKNRKINERIEKLQSDRIVLVNITKAVQNQTTDLRALIRDTDFTASDRVELEDEVNEGSRIIEELLSRNIKVEQQVLRDLQLALFDSAKKLRGGFEEEEKVKKFSGRPTSIFQEQGKKVLNDLDTLEDLISQPSGSIGTDIANGLQASFDVDETVLTETFKRNFRAQQRAMIELGETP